MKRIQLILTCLLVALSATLQAQGQQVKGSIVDSKGEPVAGVSVVVEGTTLGVITGSDGEFTISAKDGQVLNFYLFGMKSQKVTVSGPVLKVTMQEDLLALDEAVVTALGITRSEKSLGYAATTVKNDEIVGYHATNATNALAGKVAGLQISSTTTDPGAATNVIIRGYSSINGNNQPLYVVDGIVIGGLGNIASEDIESLTVLKGAAATALYGSRASNGVIIITTKQGKRGADRLFSIEYSGGVELVRVGTVPRLSSRTVPGVLSLMVPLRFTALSGTVSNSFTSTAQSLPISRISSKSASTRSTPSPLTVPPRIREQIISSPILTQVMMVSSPERRILTTVTPSLSAAPTLLRNGSNSPARSTSQRLSPTVFLWIRDRL